jgi:hypothetical protein
MIYFFSFQDSFPLPQKCPSIPQIQEHRPPQYLITIFLSNICLNRLESTQQSILSHILIQEIIYFLIIPFYLQSAPVHSANCVCRRVLSKDPL